MEKRITGMHHIVLRPTKENYDRTVRFYVDVLGFSIEREWVSTMNGAETNCSIIDTGNGVLVEIFGNGGSDDMPLGAIPHVCYETEDVDGAVRVVQAAGYPATGTPWKAAIRIWSCAKPRATPYAWRL